MERRRESQLGQHNLLCWMLKRVTRMVMESGRFEGDDVLCLWLLMVRVVLQGL